MGNPVTVQCVVVNEVSILVKTILDINTVMMLGGINIIKKREKRNTYFPRNVRDVGVQKV